jgi:hypothetical protein
MQASVGVNSFSLSYEPAADFFVLQGVITSCGGQIMQAGSG